MHQKQVLLENGFELQMEVDWLKRTLRKGIPRQRAKIPLPRALLPEKLFLCTENSNNHQVHSTEVCEFLNRLTVKPFTSGEQLLGIAVIGGIGAELFIGYFLDD